MVTTENDIRDNAHHILLSITHYMLYIWIDLMIPNGTSKELSPEMLQPVWLAKLY